jgi:hypothetical protein
MLVLRVAAVSVTKRNDSSMNVDLKVGSIVREGVDLVVSVIFNNDHQVN